MNKLITDLDISITNLDFMNNINYKRVFEKCWSITNSYIRITRYRIFTIKELKNIIHEHYKMLDDMHKDTPLDNWLRKFYEYTMGDIEQSDISAGFNINDILPNFFNLNNDFIPKPYDYNLFINLCYYFYISNYFLEMTDVESINRLLIFMLIFLVFEKTNDECLDDIANIMFHGFETNLKKDNIIGKREANLAGVYNYILSQRTIIELRYGINFNNYNFEDNTVSVMSKVIACYEYINDMYQTYITNPMNKDAYCRSMYKYNHLFLKNKVTKNDFLVFLTENKYNAINNMVLKDNEVLNLYIILIFFMQMFTDFCNQSTTFDKRKITSF